MEAQPVKGQIIRESENEAAMKRKLVEKQRKAEERLAQRTGTAEALTDVARKEIDERNARGNQDRLPLTTHEVKMAPERSDVQELRSQVENESRKTTEEMRKVFPNLFKKDSSHQ